MCWRMLLLRLICQFVSPKFTRINHFRDYFSKNVLPTSIFWVHPSCTLFSNHWDGGIEMGWMYLRTRQKTVEQETDTLVSFLQHIQINALPSRDTLVTNWRLCNNESYILSGARQSLDVSPAAESTLDVKCLYSEPGGKTDKKLPRWALLPRTWQEWSLPKLHVAPQPLKCKFENHYRDGKHQHISHIKAGRQED